MIFKGSGCFQFPEAVVRKMTAYPGCAGLARSPFVLTEHISSLFIYLFIYLFIWYVGPLFPPGLLIVKREELSFSHF